MNQILEHPDNDKILSEILADHVKKARELKNPSAEWIIDNVKVGRIIYK